MEAMTTNTLVLGCDPGWRSAGYALLSHNDATGFTPVMIGVDDPSQSGSRYPSVFAAKLHEHVAPNSGSLAYATMERFVPYNNTFSTEAENIVMMIGGLREAIQPWAQEVASTLRGRMLLVRAIDWKVSLVKLLVKHTGFDNPSTSLDKKFSIAAAKHILNGKYDFKTDHEADAICLAAFPQLLEKYTTLPKRR